MMTRSCALGVAMNAIVVLLFVPTTICLPQVLQPRKDFGLFSREDFKDYQISGSDRIGSSPIDSSSATADSIRRTFPSSPVFPTNQQQQLQSSPNTFSETSSTGSATPPISSSSSSSSTAAAAVTATAGVSSVATSTPQSNVSYASTDDVAAATGTANASDSSVSSGNATEKEKVIMAPSTGDQSKISTYSEIFQHTLVWLNDTYVLSILIPVCFGFVVASVVIVAVATCRCIRRRYLRRRLRSNVLPESIKSMRRSDRTRLLAESSDEEF